MQPIAVIDAEPAALAIIGRPATKVMPTKAATKAQTRALVLRHAKR